MRARRNEAAASGGVTSLLAVALLMAGQAVRAQGADPAPSQGYGEELSVLVVEVPVQVLRNGEPVRGLTRDDFELYDGREKREITSFEVVDLASAPADPAASNEPGRNLLMLFDFDLSTAQMLKRGAQGAREVVESGLHPRDRAAVALYSAITGPRLLTGFTEDRAELTAALDLIVRLQDRRFVTAELKQARQRLATEAGKASAPRPPLRRDRLRGLVADLGPTAALALSSASFGLASPLTAAATASDLSLISFSESGGQTAGESGGDAVLAQVAAQDASDLLADSIDAAAEAVSLRQARTMSDSLGTLVTLLRDLKGPKHLLYYSAGFPGGALRLHGMARAAERLFARFRATGWTIQAIDLAGIRPALRGDIGADSPAGPGGADFAGSAFAANALLYLANGTGGEVFENYNRPADATRVVLNHTSVTYLLSFATSELPSDGRYHDLDVRLREPLAGSRILHRRGYYAPSPARQRSDLELQLNAAASLLGNRERGDVTARLLAMPLPQAWAAPSVAATPIAFVVEVPPQQALLAAGETLADLELQVAAVDAESRPADLVTQRIGLDLARQGAALEEGGLRYFGDLALPPGHYRLRTRLVNRSTLGEHLSTVQLEVPAMPPALSLLPPLFVEAAPAGVQLRETPATASLVRYPFVLGGRDFLPRVEPSFRPGEAGHICVQLEGEAAASSAVGARVLTAAGRAVAAGSVQLLAREAAADHVVRLIGRLETDQLPPGDYRLEVRASLGEDAVTSSALFSVVAP